MNSSLFVQISFIVYCTSVFCDNMLLTIYGFVWSLGNPRAVSLQVVGAAVEGTVLSAEKEYWGGEEGASVFRWFRVSTSYQTFKILFCVGFSMHLLVVFENNKGTPSSLYCQ